MRAAVVVALGALLMSAGHFLMAFDQPFLDSLYEKYFSLKRLQDGSGTLLAGVTTLKDGTGKLVTGATQLDQGIGQLDTQLKESSVQ